MDRLIANDIFNKILQSNVPQGKQVLGSRNVTKQKFDLDGNPIFKVCTVVQGHQQEPGKSYNNTFSNTLAFEAFCITVAAVAHYDFDAHIIDVTGTYTSTQLNCNTALETFSLLIASHVLGQSLPNLACGISTLCSTFVQSLLSIKLVVQSVDFIHLLQHDD
jgi:hypothetical protein